MAEQDRRLVLAAVGRLPVRTREILATAGRPGLFTPSPDRRYLLQQIPAKPYQPTRLARLDLATGKLTYLPSGWLRLFAIVYW